MNIAKLLSDTGEEIGWALWVGGKIAVVFETREEALAAKKNEEYRNIMEELGKILEELQQPPRPKFDAPRG